MKLRTAADAVAWHCWTDTDDVREHRYQSTRYSNVFSLGDKYFTATTTRKPCVRFSRETFGEWKQVGEALNWKVWVFNSETSLERSAE